MAATLPNLSYPLCPSDFRGFTGLAYAHQISSIVRGHVPLFGHNAALLVSETQLVTRGRCYESSAGVHASRAYTDTEIDKCHIRFWALAKIRDKMTVNSRPSFALPGTQRPLRNQDRNQLVRLVFISWG